LIHDQRELTLSKDVFPTACNIIKITSQQMLIKI